MKISQEQFDKLSQLDRIEYRQIEKKIDEKYSGSASLHVLNHALLPIIAFFLLIIPLYHHVFGGGIFFRLMFAFKFCMNLGFIMLGLCILVDIIFYVLYKKQKEKLNQKYFNLNIKHEQTKDRKQR